ncbi:MAG TPA: hypothetical protein VE267_03145, partial [Bradyrhizobium sp.]|nr:hypothetical protein [Bradyrhizobium sp.]
LRSIRATTFTCRHCEEQRDEAIQLRSADAKLDCFASLAMTGKQTCAPPDLHDTVMSACRGALADFKVPREIRFVDEMPRSTLEKVAKAELRKLLE